MIHDCLLAVWRVWEEVVLDLSFPSIENHRRNVFPLDLSLSAFLPQFRDGIVTTSLDSSWNQYVEDSCS